MRLIISLVCLTFLAGCRNTYVREPLLSTSSADAQPMSSVKEPQEPSPPLEVIPMEPVTLGEGELNAALKLLTKGKAEYLNGQYELAENHLKEALLVYPFLPEARLLLAKVLLVKGAASRELATLKMAKLMLEMALAMQPDLEEADRLLELFRLEVDAAAK